MEAEESESYWLVWALNTGVNQIAVIADPMELFWSSSQTTHGRTTVASWKSASPTRIDQKKEGASAAPLDQPISSDQAATAAFGSKAPLE